MGGGKSVGLPRQEYWHGLSSPPGHLPNPGIEPMSPALQVASFTSELPGKSNRWCVSLKR